MSAVCRIPGIGEVCTAATAPVGAAAGAVTDGVLATMRTACIEACVWAIMHVVDGLGATSRPAVTGAAVGADYRFMAAVAVVCMLPLIALAALTALIRSDPGLLIRAVAGALPAAALLTAVGIALTQALSDAVDVVSAQLLAPHAADGRVLARAIPAALGATPVPVLIGVAVAGAAMCAALAVWVELLVRAAAVEVATIFLPLAFAGIVWPATARYARRLAEMLAALIASKLVIVGTVALGLAELTGATVSGVLAGTAMLGLAAFAPFLLLRLIPLAVDAGDLSERRRSTASARMTAREAGGLQVPATRAAAPRAPRHAPALVAAITPASVSVGRPSGAPGRRRIRP